VNSKCSKCSRFCNTYFLMQQGTGLLETLHRVDRKLAPIGKLTGKVFQVLQVLQIWTRCNEKTRIDGRRVLRLHLAQESTT